MNETLLKNILAVINHYTVEAASFGQTEMYTVYNPETNEIVVRVYSNPNGEDCILVGPRKIASYDKKYNAPDKKIIPEHRDILIVLAACRAKVQMPTIEKNRTARKMTPAEIAANKVLVNLLTRKR